MLSSTNQAPSTDPGLDDQLVSSIQEVAARLFREDATFAVQCLAELELQSFHSSRAILQFPECVSPELSILVVLFNRAELTLQCLLSIGSEHLENAEIVLIDNASTDSTNLLLEKVTGARTFRNRENLYFVRAANQAARESRGKYILFLNNDTQLQPGCVSSALATIRTSDDIGAVGGKLIFPDGTLQEAGAIIWKDGICAAYGRGDDPFAPMYMFRRDTDYCSAAFLLTRRDLFWELGGFDERYRPAYYEDADYCMKLRQKGLRVLFDPDAALLHHEFASSASREEAIELETRNRGVFSEIHRESLENHFEGKTEDILFARSPAKPAHRILWIDEAIPHPSLGAGYPRAAAILSALLRLNCFVTLYPTVYCGENWHDVYRDVYRETEVMSGYGIPRLQEFLGQRKGYYDIVLVSRPKNMEILAQLRESLPELFAGARILYDAEAIFALRDFRDSTEAEKQKQMRKEFRLASVAQTVITVSEVEQALFLENGCKNVFVLGHALAPDPTPRAFEDRHGFLFVGAVHGDSAPNADALVWFVEEILPLIRKQLGEEVTVTFAGLNHSERVERLQIEKTGSLPDLTALYDHARAFVAPSRFGAGLPYKVHEAAARGVPVVATQLLADQLGWIAETDMLVAADPESFAAQCVRLYLDASLWQSIRMNALARINSECSFFSFLAKLRSMLSA